MEEEQPNSPITPFRRFIIIVGALIIGYFAGIFAAVGAIIVFTVTGGLGWMTTAPNEFLYNFLAGLLGFAVGIPIAYITYRNWTKPPKD